MHKRLRHLILALLLALAALVGLPPLTTQALALQGDVHHLAFASDYHSTEGSIRNAMQGMPEDVEYVSLIGDLVGGGRDRSPEFLSRDILGLVQEVFPRLDATNVSLIWADHDANVDDAGTDIVKCLGGYGSGPIYQGFNEDGSTAYYIYAVGFYEMKQGGAISEEAAAGFKTWVDSVDPTIPIIVLCHMPLTCKRGDNFGALYWNEALNYAATGVEGIISTGPAPCIARNVIFLCGHNHTVDQDELYFGAGGTMEVQIDASAEEGPYSESALAARGVPVLVVQSEDEKYAQEEELLEPASLGPLDDEGGTGTEGEPVRPPRPHHEAKGVTSSVYYTSLVAGYLKTSGNATLITIDDEDISLEKHNGGQVVALGVDGVSGAEVESPVPIAQFTRVYEHKHASVSVSKVGEDGSPLAGATFALRRGGDVLGTYVGGDFALSTADDTLSAFLPAAGETSALTLQETLAPAGYALSDASHEIVVSAREDEELIERTYVNTTIYSMTIDGGQMLTVANAKVPPQQPVTEQSGSSGTAAKREGNVAHKPVARKALPATGDAPGAHPGQLLVMSLALCGLGLAVRRSAA